ncbi:Prolyl 4-hydroxylase subunit alpha-2 [Thelohanellus kitauei]|uniref:Prolyl 4-hydroxylase subunit alpha-2 n=1 Tax=Thelohanellus kitauei TaxID=669202 RepID=A0A0C2IU46_THEKT|nr:Prolyl 4-hydroxylase subunit alpha-2 [Thelohanellus kitauei]
MTRIPVNSKMITSYDLILGFIIFDHFLLSNQEIYTANIKLCELFMLELNELQLYDSILSGKKNDEKFLNLILEISKQIPTELLTTKTVKDKDCFDEYSDINRFISNPINSLMLIKRFIQIWPNIQNYSILPRNSRLDDFIKQFEFGKDDLTGAYEALYRIQDFYQLEAQDMKTGMFSDEWKSIAEIWSSVPKFMGPDDMLEIGIIAYQQENYQSAIMWFESALDEINNIRSYSDESSLITVLDYLSWSE